MKNPKSLNVLTCNLWEGRRLSDLLDWLFQNAKKFDVICFQEVYRFDSPKLYDPRVFTVGRPGGPVANLFQRLEHQLPSFDGLFAPARQGFFDGVYYPKSYFPVEFGNAIFVRRGLDYQDFGHEFVHGDLLPYGERLGEGIIPPRGIQMVLVEGVLVTNYHGIHKANTLKHDIPERIEQAERYVEILSKHRQHPLVCVGDFNLRPENLSFLHIQEELGLLDIVSITGVTSTRVKGLYRNYDLPGNTLMADYVLTEKGRTIRPTELKVWDEVLVSDHMPVSCQIELNA